MNDKKLRYGLIGCGAIARIKHMAAVALYPDEVEMAAFCDVIEERAVEYAKEYGTPDAKVYTDYKELLKDETIDAVIVATPNRSHSFITIDSLEAGKHVLCEKPMAKTYEEAKAMVETAKRTGKILTIGYQNRYREDVSYAKATCEEDELGEVYMAKAHAIRRRKVPTWGVFLDEYEQGGGPLIDIGTHALDLTLWCMNNYEPARVVGSVYHKLGKQTKTGNVLGDWDPEKMTVEDSAFGFITMKNGASIYLEASWALNMLDEKEAKFTLCGTKGGIDFDDGVRVNTVKHNKMTIEKPDLASEGVPLLGKTQTETIGKEERIFIDAIKKGTEVVVKPEQALVVTQILEAIYESAKTGKAIYFD